MIDHHGELAQVMHNGVLVEYGGYYGPLSSEVIRCMRGIHEPQEEVAFAVVLDQLTATLSNDRQPVMIELGSFWAYYSLWFLDRFPSGRSICLEPDPANLDLGRRNFALNNRQGTFLHAAIGNGHGDFITFHPDGGGPPIELPGHDLESLLDTVSLDYVDLLLADIQGGEVPLLERAIDRLRSGAVRFMVISTHDLSITGSATTHQKVLKMLTDAGAHVICEHSVSESFSGDGLVVVSFEDRDSNLRAPISYARARSSLFGEWEPRAEEYRSEVHSLRGEVADNEAKIAQLTNQLEQSTTQ